MSFDIDLNRYAKQHVSKDLLNFNEYQPQGPVKQNFSTLRVVGQVAQQPGKPRGYSSANRRCFYSDNPQPGN